MSEWSRLVGWLHCNFQFLFSSKYSPCHHSVFTWTSLKPLKALIDWNLTSSGSDRGIKGQAHPGCRGQRGRAQLRAGRRSAGENPAARSREGPERGGGVCGRGFPQGQVLPAGLHAAIHAQSGERVWGGHTAAGYTRGHKQKGHKLSDVRYIGNNKVISIWCVSMGPCSSWNWGFGICF